MTVRAGGRWRWAGLGVLRVEAAHGVPEEAPRASGFEGGPSGSLTPRGPSQLRAAARRPGFYRQKAPPKTWFVLLQIWGAESQNGSRPQRRR